MATVSEMHARDLEQETIATTIETTTATKTTATTATTAEGSYQQLPQQQQHHQSLRLTTYELNSIPPPASSDDDTDALNDHPPTTISRPGAVREIEAESLIAPILSRTQSSVLYASAASHNQPLTRTSPISSDDEAGEPEQEQEPESPSTPVTPVSVPVTARPALKPTPVDDHHNHIPSLHRHPQTQQVHHQHQHHHKKNTFSLSSFNLPSLPKNVSLPSFDVSLPSFVRSEASSESIADRFRRQRAKTTLSNLNLPSTKDLFSSPRSATFFSRSPRDAEFPKAAAATGAADTTSAALPTPSRPKPLRRSSSASSLHRISLVRMHTGGSATSSIGDDARFHHVTQMTNSRFKAIKDQFISGLPDVPQLHQIRQHVASLNPFNESEASPVLPKSPALDAIDTVTGDVVVMGGYRGSILRDTATGRRVWIPLKVGFNLRKIDLELGLNPEDEEMAEHQIYADGMLKSISGVDISRRLIRRLKANAAQHDRRVHDWGYDWRLSPALIADRLIKFLESLPCNQLSPGEDPMTKRKGKGAMVIAHSLGGLIVRYAINQRPELFSGVLFAGTPQHCVNILGPLRNGDSVLFNSKVFTAQVNFTLRSSYAFLPEDGTCFVDKKTGESLPVDFYDVENWKKYGLSPCVSDVPIQTQQQHQHHQRNVLGSVTPNINLLSTAKEKEKDILNPSSLTPQLNSSSTSSDTPTPSIPTSRALPYLSRTLSSTRSFRQQLQYKSHLEPHYPVMTVLYSKTTPTVKGARVDGYEGIKRNDVYEELVFGAGDGVCLAKAAMLPVGYRCVKKVAVDRGHVALLGELEGVGVCVRAMVEERGW
ncbi:hypothetical protein BZA77DRAFT_354040 [Pyronema omphalodes]|nr:hypothetical protein BZA77DRAFT_354040 [Pyronema omphalodes]